MAELSTFARPYAEALFRIAKSGGAAKLGEWSACLAQLSSLAGHAEMQAVIGNPNVPADQLYELVTSALNVPLTDEVKNLVQTLVDNDRLMVLPLIARQFELLKNAHEGSADAEIVSAFALDETQLASLVAAMEKKFGVKLKPQVRVDENLIGGIRVTVGDRVLDNSVRAQLEKMKIALAA